MTDARKRAEEALRMFDRTATPKPHEVYLYRAIAALREILAEEDERGLHNPWRSRALDAEMALRVLLDQKRSGREPDVERFVYLAMRHASPLRTPAPPAADEVREAAERLRALAAKGLHERAPNHEARLTDAVWDLLSALDARGGA